MHPMPVFANDSLLRMLPGLQRCSLCSSRSSEWMLFFKGIGDVLRNRLDFLKGDARAREKSATRSGFRGGQKPRVYIRGFRGRSSGRDEGEFLAGGGWPWICGARTATDRKTTKTHDPCGCVKLHHFFIGGS